ncbi:MAG TPA: hypothetical protein PKB15_06970 [Acidimicrobiia bacterium]|nr:hypothetical protein [Acidimicrobiia bacterium]
MLRFHEHAILSPKKTASLVATAIVVILIFVLALSPQDSHKKRSLSGTLHSERKTNDQKSKPRVPVDSLPACAKSENTFGGNFTFDCMIDETKIHFEYFSTLNDVMTLATTYGLTNDAENITHYIRTGIVKNNARLMAIDTEKLLVVNVTSPLAEKELRSWWNNYSKNN